MKELRSERLILRALRPEDADSIFKNWAGDPDVTRYLGWYPHGHAGVTRTVLEKWMEEYARTEGEKVWRYGIELLETGELIGMIDVVGYHHGNPVIGYASGKRFWGHGYMTEALKMLVQELREAGYEALVIMACEENAASNRVIEKAGFTYVFSERRKLSEKKPEMHMIREYRMFFPENVAKEELVDLHMHSTASDGTDTPEELLKNLRARGITTFALTDHDTTDGAREMLPLVPSDMTYYPGIEFSCVTKAGKCHILGLGLDLDDGDLNAAIRHGHEIRLQKFETRLQNLKEQHGIIFTEEELRKLHENPSVGRPHIASLLIEKGYVSTISEAMDRYLKTPIGTFRIDAKEAIDAIHHAGGVAVWAHPLGGEGEAHVRGEKFLDQLELLISEGIQGFECYYSRYNPSEVRFLMDEARERGLLISGGSDYHGSRKNIALCELNAFGMPVKKGMLTVLNQLTENKRLRGSQF